MSKFPILVISDGTQASKMKPSILEFFQNGLNFTTKHCLKSVQIWSLFSPNMRENTDQKKLRIWTLFTQ